MYFPSAMAIIPQQPIMDFGTAMPLDDAYFIINAFPNAGSVTAWRFYAVVAGQVSTCKAERKTLLVLVIVLTAE